MRLTHRLGDVVIDGDRELRIEERIGGGGMSTVYKVRDPESKQVFALKACDLLDLDHGGLSKTATAAFEREAAVAARCDAEGIPEIHRIHVENPDPYLCRARGCKGNAAVCETCGGTCLFIPERLYLRMPYYEGRDLAAWAMDRDKPLLGGDLKDFLKIIADAADILASLHRQGFVHRDMKPDHVMVLADQSVVLLDFGLAAGVDEPMDELLRDWGTEGFIAGEREWNRSEPAVDSYALAMTVLAIGLGLDPGNPVHARRLTHETPSELWPGLDLPVAELLAAALHPDPKQRPSMARWREVCRVLSGKVSTRPIPSSVVERPAGETENAGLVPLQRAEPAVVVPAVHQPQAPSGGKKRRLWVGLVLVLVLLLIVGFSMRRALPNNAFRVIATSDTQVFPNPQMTADAEFLESGAVCMVTYPKNPEHRGWLRLRTYNGKKRSGWLRRDKVIRPRDSRTEEGEAGP